MNHVRCILWIVLMLTVLPAAGAAAPRGVDLARMHDWDIVVAERVSESEFHAAQEFQRHFAEATGVTLPIVRNSQGPDRHVFIGAGRSMQKSALAFSVEEFGPEDLRIVVRDDNIVIAGGPVRGTLYGVYTFLEDYLGVRFLAPDHTHVPPVGRWRVIGPVDRFYSPPIDFRWVSYEASYARPDYCARMRLNAARVPIRPVDDLSGKGLGPFGGRTPIHRTEHSFGRQLPPRQYAKDHPDYYCLFKGFRLATVKPGEGGFDFKSGSYPYGMQPCLTHPDVLRIVTDRVLDRLEDRRYLTAPVSQNDGGAHCQCDQCAPIDEREGTKAGALLEFVNKVADVVAREYPDRFVSTLAYSDTAAPPKTLRPRDNVIVTWCSISTCFIHAFDDRSCEQNVWHIEQLRRWAKITRHLYVWNYYLNDETRGYQLPLPNLRHIGHNVRFQMSLGVKGMFMQTTSSSHGNEWEDLRNYVLSRVLWDPSIDDDRVIREWVTLRYGPAASPIQGWIDRLHDRSAASGKHCRCLGGRFADYGLDESDAEAGLAAFEQAMRLAGDDFALRHRVEKASLWAYRAAIDPVWNIKEDETVDLALAERMLPRVRRFFELCKVHGVTRTHELYPQEIERFETKLEKVLGK
ncbi:MAG: hypothetical protein CMJ18_00515 [Phycisphaeraceae bacterium]|nr:hypothetical protein [Phycisphaeraceae bacterium]